MTNPFSWLKSIHEAVYKEEDQPKFISNQWGTPMASNYTVTGICNPVGLTTVAQTQNYGSVVGVSMAGSISSNQYLGQGIGVSYAPTGTFCQIAFTDANGHTWSLTVDQAFAQTMAQISQAHSYRQQYVYAPQAPNNPWPTLAIEPAPSQKMIDGDFSFDEMEEAELLILELEGGRDSHSQDQEAISASQA